MDISVIVPVYNNERTLSELIKRLRSTLKNYSYELIFVDDGSSDMSKKIILEHSEYFGEQIILHSLETNRGQQLATLKGLQIANGELVAVLDADLQDKPEIIPHLIEKIGHNSGSCFVERKGLYQNIFRMTTSFLFKSLILALTNLKVGAGSFYVMDRVTKHKLLKLAGMINQPYLTIILAGVSEKISYVQWERDVSPTKSSYTFSKRLQASHIAFSCAVKCRVLRKKFL